MAIETQQAAQTVAVRAENRQTIPAELASYGTLLATLLAERGIASREEAEIFLNPRYERDLHDPFFMLGMGRAVDRVLRAIKEQESIVVYADYDCDGIPGAVILHDFFKKIGYDRADTYIPHRHEEGYGLHIEALERMRDNGVSLIITVDCGITDVAEVAHANALGIDVIVTDHHLPGPELPPAYAILDSKQEGDQYPDRMLCGAGVAFKLVQGLLLRGRFDVLPEWEKWLLDMAGLATIADMVPLRNENRALAHFGLKVLRKSPRPGLRKLLSKMNVSQGELTEEDVGFMIAPRINAASRIDIPFEAFRLLATRDEKTANELSDHLHRINETRKGLVAATLKEARHMLASEEPEAIVVVGSPKWRPGILGLVAMRLVEDFGRPAFVWGRGETLHLKGSCRSDGTVSIMELMSRVEEGVFVDIGGHEFSGGFTITRENIHVLKEKLLVSYQNVARREKGDRAIVADARLSLEDVNNETYTQIERLAPFGVDNPKPLFLFRNLSIARIRRFGKEKNHLELSFNTPSKMAVNAAGFYLNGEACVPGDVIDLIASIERTSWGNGDRLRLRIAHILD